MEASLSDRTLFCRGPFLESPATFQAFFRYHKFLCILIMVRFSFTKFHNHFGFCYLENILKTNLLKQADSEKASQARKVFGTLEKWVPGTAAEGAVKKKASNSPGPSR